MGKILAVTNQKGGVGKTTTSVNLTASLAFLKRRVLLIDFDPQGNASVACGVDKDTLKYTSSQVLCEHFPLKEAIITVKSGFDVLATTQDLIVAEMQLLKQANRELQLKTILAEVRDDYDYIIIDCPPSLNILTVNALTAANSVLIPVQCEYFALEGLSGLIDTINQIKQSVNPSLSIEGLVRTMYDSRTRLTLDVSEQLMQHFPNQVYQTTIPRNIRLAEAPSHGMPIIHYDDKSQGAVAYLALAKELMQREKERKVFAAA